jgi:hypothetical protein
MQVPAAHADSLAIFLAKRSRSVSSVSNHSRPTDYTILLQIGNCNRRAIVRLIAYLYDAFQNEIKIMGRIPLLENDLPREARIRLKQRFE